MLLIVFAAAGLGGVLYWRQSLHAPSAPVAAATGEPAKEGKKRHRRKRGARRLARNEVAVVAAAPPGEAPPGEAPPGEDTSPSFAPSAPPAPRRPCPGCAGRLIDDRGGARGCVRRALVRHRRAHRPRAACSVSPSDEPEPIKLRPGDLKIVWQGEDSSKAENMRLDFSNDAVGRELSQDEIDARFRTKEDAVLGCVARARPDEYTFIPGRITVRFRIQRTGAVKGVQVEAPVILHKGGLTGCIKGVVGSLRFPASNMSQVISYPFSLL